MEQSEKPKWQREIEAMLQLGVIDKRLDMALELIKVANTIEKPSGEVEKAVAPILTAVSKELPPLSAVYTAFRIGMAYERYQNANRA